MSVGRSTLSPGDRFLRLFVKNDEEKILIKQIFFITLPSFLELFLSTLFNSVDLIMVGKLSPEAIAGVGITNQPFFLLITIFSAINVGTTTLVAWAVGSGNRKRGSLVVRQAILFNLVAGIVVSLVGVFFAGPVMEFMTAEAARRAVTPEETASYLLMLKHATEYFEIISASVACAAVTMGITAALRGSGQTRIPMAYNIIANLVNVGLNFVLIYGHLGLPAMGVSGAALATSISRAIAMILAVSVIFFFKHSDIRLRFRDSWKPDFSIIRELFSIGMPSAGEQFVIQGGLTVFNRILSGLGSIAYAAHQIVSNVNSLAFSVSQAFSISTTTLVGQAVGADDYVKAENITKLTRRFARMITFVIALIFVVFGKDIALLFNDTANAAEVAVRVAETAAPVFIIAAMIQFIQSSQMSTAGALRGSGDTVYPLYASLFGIVLCRLTLAYVFVIKFGWGIMGGWMAFLGDQCIRNVVIKLRFNTGKWKKMKAIKEEKTRKRNLKYQI